MALDEVVSELNRLQRGGLISNYAIGGAVAAQAYIAPMSTEDVDVFVVFAGDGATSLAPLELIYADLIRRGARVDGPYIEIGGWPVQILPAHDALYEAAVSNAREILFGVESGRVMGPEYLAAIALRTGRGKDHLRLLEFMNTRVLDRELFARLIAESGLTENWHAFQAKFLTDR